MQKNMAKRQKNTDRNPLVIVESPAKARTISKFLGPKYTIEASIGHIRDLPEAQRKSPRRTKAKIGPIWA